MTSLTPTERSSQSAATRSAVWNTKERSAGHLDRRKLAVYSRERPVGSVVKVRRGNTEPAERAPDEVGKMLIEQPTKPRRHRPAVCAGVASARWPLSEAYVALWRLWPVIAQRSPKR